MPNLDIFVAAHPEFPPRRSTSTSASSAPEIDAGADALIANIVTDTDAFFRYRDRAHAAGIAQPIIPSLLPLNSARRCDFLARELHIPYRPRRSGLARRTDRRRRRLAHNDLVAKLARLIDGGAPGANFNVIVPGDADFVVRALTSFRGTGAKADAD